MDYFLPKILDELSLFNYDISRLLVSFVTDEKTMSSDELYDFILCTPHPTKYNMFKKLIMYDRQYTLWWIFNQWMVYNLKTNYTKSMLIDGGDDQLEINLFNIPYEIRWVVVDFNPKATDKKNSCHSCGKIGRNISQWSIVDDACMECNEPFHKTDWRNRCNYCGLYLGYKQINLMYERICFDCREAEDYADYQSQNYRY